MRIEVIMNNIHVHVYTTLSNIYNSGILQSSPVIHVSFLLQCHENVFNITCCYVHACPHTHTHTCTRAQGTNGMKVYNIYSRLKLRNNKKLSF